MRRAACLLGERRQGWALGPTIGALGTPAHIHAGLVDTQSASARHQRHALVGQQSPLAFETAGIACEMSRTTNHAVTGDDNSHRIASQGLRHGTHGFWLSEGGSNALVTHDGSIGNVGRHSEDGALEITPHEHVVNGPGEAGAGTGEVGLQFCDEPLGVLTVCRRRPPAGTPRDDNNCEALSCQATRGMPRGDVAMAKAPNADVTWTIPQRLPCRRCEGVYQRFPRLLDGPVEPTGILEASKHLMQTPIRPQDVPTRLAMQMWACTALLQ